MSYCGSNLYLKVDGANITGSNASVWGNKNNVVGSNATVVGNGNNVVGSNADVYGNNNIVTGSNATAYGTGNQIRGSNGDMEPLIGAPKYDASKKRTEGTSSSWGGIVVTGGGSGICVNDMVMTGGSCTTTIGQLIGSTEIPDDAEVTFTEKGLTWTKGSSFTMIGDATRATINGMSYETYKKKHKCACSSAKE